MGKRSQAIVSELLAMTVADRQAILEKVLKSIEPEERDDSIEAELDRRWKEVISGKVKMDTRQAWE
jgi:hypothetical protein